MKNVLSRATTVDPDLDTDEKIINFSSQYIAGTYNNLQAVTPFDVIVAGIGRVYYTNAGAKRGELFVVPKVAGQKPVLRFCSFEGADSDIVRNLQPMTLFNKVNLMSFRNGDLKSDFRAHWESPAKVDMAPMSFLDKLGIQKITIAQSVDHIAPTDAQGWSDKTKWVVIEAMIVDYRKGQKKKDEAGTKLNDWAVYVATDNSLSQEYITPDGSKHVKPAISIWVNPVLMTLDRSSKARFAGYLSVDPKSKEVSMTAYLIDPVFSMGGIPTQ